MEAVTKDIETTGTYQLTGDELIFATKLAWRNAPRCIGRIQWANLQVSLTGRAEGNRMPVLRQSKWPGLLRLQSNPEMGNPGPPSRSLEAYFSTGGTRRPSLILNVEDHMPP